MTKQNQEHAKSTLEHYGVNEATTLNYSTHYIGNVGTALSRAYLVVDGELYNVTGLVANAIGNKVHTKDGRDYLKTTGYGYNRAQHITSNLSYVLFGKPDALAYKEV